MRENGSQVPDFTLPAVAGGTRTLASFLEPGGTRGAVVVFWSGVCSHCARYDDYLRAFPGRHPELALVAVASRQGETAADLRRVAAERRLPFPVLHDADRTVAAAWRVAQTPRAFLIAGGGDGGGQGGGEGAGPRLLYRGAIDNFKYPEDPAYEAYLEPAIAAFLAGRPVPRAESPSFGCPVESVYYTLPGPIRR
ncbi:MAG TPA: redoxin domain-containing protein [Thermoanaerobaculia bacterium]|nr:redoxin domain-containing protein [Thermoanaerobaculia bacterium]